MPAASLPNGPGASSSQPTGRQPAAAGRGAALPRPAAEFIFRWRSSPTGFLPSCRWSPWSPLSLFGVPARIKWVNDIYIHNKKVCGILTELLSGTDGRPSGLIVGIGINLAVRAFPPELPYAGAVGEFAADVPYERVVACVLRALFDCFALPPEQLVGEYRRHNLLLGRRIRFPYAGRLREGVAADIDSCGCLVADCGGEQITLSSNDISVEWDREG